MIGVIIKVDIIVTLWKLNHTIIIYLPTCC